MKQWLRNLIVAEEGYFADHGTYTTDLAALRILQDLRTTSASDSVTLRVIYAGGSGWSAEAIHRGAPRQNCVAFVGELKHFPSPPQTRDGSFATSSGLPICDRF